jgi:PKD repeat protein
MKKLLILFVIFVIAFGQPSYSQHLIKGEKSSLTKQKTVRVSELKQEEPEAKTIFKVPNKEWAPPEWKVNKDDVIYMEPKGFRENAIRSVTLNSPAPDTSFHGLDDNGASIPPDVNGAAGPDHLMITLNTEVRIQDRNGNNLFTTSLNNFWTPMPNNGGSFDPKIVYDPYENRWIIVTPSGSSSPDSRLYIGVSATSDPMGDWYMFWLDPDPQNQTWFDYPSFGFNKKWITISGNMFGNDYYRTVFVIDKMAAYNGDEAPSYTRFVTSEGFTLVPSLTYDTAAEDMYLICTSNGNSGGNGYIKKFKVSGDVDNPVFEYEGAIGVPEPWENGAGQSGNFLPQLGSPELINSVDSRMEKVIYRNGKIWAVHHIFLPVGNPQRTAVQWWELDTDGTVLQRGRIDDTTNLFSFAFPTIAVNNNEDVLIGYSVFSSTQYASAGYSFKAYYDEDNTMRNYFQFKDGENPYYKTYGGGRNRWGDYSATCVDPVNGYDFWTLQEYAASPENKWGTWWAYLRPSFPPIAEFTSDEVLVPVGEQIDFTDQTAGIPSSWKWTFEDGEPATSTAQNPQNIRFNSEGSFDVTLIVSNELGADTIVKENYITTSSTLLPEINFSVDQSKVCIGEPVHFIDNTVNSPNQWDWQFNPSSVTFIEETSPASPNPVVVFDEAGSYSVTLTVWNLNGSVDTIAYDVVLAGGLTPYYKETFEINQFSVNSWTVENPDDDVTWELFEVGGTSPGNTAAGINFSEYFTIGQRDRLISPSFNLTGLNSAALEFQYAYAKRFDEITDSLIVYVSGDCGENWTRVFQGGEDGSGNFATHEKTDSFWPEESWDWCGSGYGASCIAIDLTPWVGQADVQIAFESYSGYGNPMFIDNIQMSQYVGEEELSQEEQTVNIYPNPNNGSFTVLFDKVNSFNKLEIFNQMGQLVYRSELDDSKNSVEISGSNQWESGVYFLKLEGNCEPVSKRVVIF